MIKTHGLTHLALAVKDPDRSLQFYEQAFGVKEYYRGAGQIQVLGPGPHDVIAFESHGEQVGQRCGVLHFGFRLTRPEDIDTAREEIEKAGGEIVEQGYFAPNEPYLFLKDPDGYEVEVWYE